MIPLFPRLPKTIAEPLARDRRRKPIAELRALAGTEHEAASFAPTGGARVTTTQLWELATAVRDLASRFEYPNPLRASSRDEIDAEVGILLHRSSGLSPTEACRAEVWNFVCCVLLPDIVRWRFPKSKGDDFTSIENFLGGDRGLDNSIGRCWWAAELLFDSGRHVNPYALLNTLGIDEIVGFTRRTAAITSRGLAVTIASVVVDRADRGLHFPRMELSRDVMKRILRLSPVVCFEAMSPVELQELISTIVDESVRGLSRERFPRA